jgi:hypothetical protein
MELQRIELDIPEELERWADQLAVAPELLEAAVRAVGTDVDKIKAFLASPASEKLR